MRALGEADLLGLWERGQAFTRSTGPAGDRRGFPETRPDSAADWPLGRRNRALAELHCLCFGPRSRLDLVPQCAEKLEFELDGEAAGGRPRRRGRANRSWSTGGLSGCRPAATWRDRRRTRSRCGGAARWPSAAGWIVGPEPAAPASAEIEWTRSGSRRVGEQMALADPLAEIMLHFDCPVCGESFEESLDLPAFLWAEMEAQAKRLLYDVHTLASAYGWSEAEILSLSAARRAILSRDGARMTGYLQRIAATAASPQPALHPLVGSIFRRTSRDAGADTPPQIEEFAGPKNSGSPRREPAVPNSRRIARGGASRPRRMVSTRLRQRLGRSRINGFSR